MKNNNHNIKLDEIQKILFSSLGRSPRRSIYVKYEMRQEISAGIPVDQYRIEESTPKFKTNTIFYYSLIKVKIVLTDFYKFSFFFFEDASP